MLKPTLLALALAAIASATPIAVTGNGSYYYSSTDGTAFHVGITGPGIWATCDAKFMWGLCSAPGEFAVIDGQHFNMFQIGIHDQGGTITGFDTQMRAVMSEELDAVMQITSNVCQGTFGFMDCMETFSIAPAQGVGIGGDAVAAPEPASWEFIIIAAVGFILGLVILEWCRRYES